MAAPANLANLLDSLSQSLESASKITPKLAEIVPPEHGLSLLDVKNDLFLAYLQNLVFLIILKIRQCRKDRSGSKEEDTILRDAAVKKLVELRHFIEKGVIPLEGKLRYQLERALQAADDEERKIEAAEMSKNSEKVTRHKHDSESKDFESGSQPETDDDDSEVSPDAPEPELIARPNPAAFVRPTASSTKAVEETAGVYRPPRIAPVVMATTERREKAARTLKSATMDEFIADEFSTTPVAEPSIGTDIGGRGRHIKTQTQRKVEDERRDYEEQHFVRLPKPGKKERAQKAKAEGRSGRMTFGGEEWRGLGEEADRINYLTKNKSGRSGTQAVLDKSRKRAMDTTDGPKSFGEIGDRYQKRLKVHEMGRRDRGKKRAR